MLKQIRNTMRSLAIAATLVITLGAGLVYANVDVGSRQDTTGPFSENLGIFDINDDLDIEVDNEFDQTNDIDVDVDAGNTDVNSNTEVGDLTTGDVNADIVFTNQPSDDGDGAFDDLGDRGTVTADFLNRITGPNSENENRLDVDRNLDIDVDNETNVDNDLDFNVSTGGNDVRNNTIVGDVTSGDINLTADIDNAVGGGCLSTCPPIGALIDFGANDVDADFANGITGPNSENRNILELDTDAEIDIENDVNIDNNFDIDADTGNNDVTNNTIVGDVTTGSVDVMITATNQAQ